MDPRLLAGPSPAAGAEPLRDHLARLGVLPAARPDLIGVLEASGLLGRGGAGFPVGRKWRSVADRSGGDARVLANGAEGEPLSAKDRAMMTLRPHLVLDGAVLAAEAVGARDAVLYVGSAHVAARTALERALGERSSARVEPATAIRIVDAPDAYVAGEESAAVQFVNAGDARPTATPPRPFEQGIDGRPTLVQNVESLAQVALIARYGDAWYRSAGRTETAGSGLVTVTGGLRPGVREVELGTTVAELADEAGQDRGATRAVLLGGYFGSWADRDTAWAMPLDPGALRRADRALGCGVVAYLGADRCGVEATARIMAYMAGQSAAQCGPCVFGLRAIADTTTRIASGRTSTEDLERIARWGRQLVGRGACHHPDGAVGLIASALDTFADEFAAHVRTGRCPLGEPARRAA
jgi:NADH:ubiquinone oxidoreductase subunit F (NADH-binding)